MEPAFRSFQQNCDVRRILSAYLFSTGIEMPRGKRTQIGPSSFVRQITDSSDCRDNLLIIQGGVNHMDSQSYYIRMAAILAPITFRIFIYENLMPMVDMNFSHQIADACSWIREQFSGSLSIVGYSMGGVVLYNYLSLGYDQADFYLPVCCPLDLETFQKNIDKHALFRMLQRVNYRKYQVTDYSEMLNFAGTNLDEQNGLIKKFIPGLNQFQSWVNKTLYCISSDDPITKNHKKELKMLEKPPAVFYIKGGWHCCLDTIRLSVQLLGQACQQIRETGKVCPKDLNPDENSFVRHILH